jgi:hypothetical protein
VGVHVVKSADTGLVHLSKLQQMDADVDCGLSAGQSADDGAVDLEIDFDISCSTTEAAAVDLDFDISGQGTEDAPAEISWDITSDEPAEIAWDVTAGEETDVSATTSTGVAGTLTDMAFRNSCINDLMELQAFLQQVGLGFFHPSVVIPHTVFGISATSNWILVQMQRT